MYHLSRNELEEALRPVNFCKTRIKTGRVEPADLLAEMLTIFRSHDANFFPPNESFTGVDLPSTYSLKESDNNLQKYTDHYWQYDPLHSA